MNKPPATIRTHLFRGAFLLSLLGVIVIPLALGQRASDKANSAANVSHQQAAPPSAGAISAHPEQPNISRTELSHLITPTNGATGVRSVPILLAPKFPQVVLYDQYNNGSTTASLSATFTDFPTFDADLADDFVVPGGQTWNVQSIDADGIYFNGVGPATSWNVFIYADNGGLPGAQVYSTLNQPVVVSNTTFSVSLNPAAVLTAGTYWIEIQANMTFGTQGEWGWTDRTVQSNNTAAWQNPGGGFGLCPSWTTKLVCIPTAGGPDQVYRINGTTGGPTPTPTPTPTATPTPSPTPCGTSKIYNIAGFGLGIQTTTTRIYDIATNTWTTGAPIPEPNGLSDHATAYWDGKIYVAGGYNGSGAISTLRAYDIASDTWSTLASMPTAEYLAGFGIINGKLYIASGNNGVTELPNLQIYDIATNTWTSGAPVPTPVTGPGCAVFNGKLYLFGGAAPFPVTISATQIYDPVSNSWSTGPNMLVARLWFYGGNIDDASIVAPGGDNSPGIPINDNEQLTGGSWIARAPLPFAARAPFAVSDGTFVYIGGGYDGSTVHADLLRYDPVANTYTPLAPSSDGHYLSQAVIVTNPCPTPTPTPTPTVTPTPTPGQIVLTAQSRRSNSGLKVRLNWTGATSAQVDIYRNGAQLARVANSGTYIDTLTTFGTYTYKVCNKGTMNCSNEVTKRFGGGGQ
jgi:Kelch motif